MDTVSVTPAANASSAGITGFLPFFAEGCDTLILGSFPSVKSRETAFYYGHPRNRFWATLAEYYSSPLPVTVEEKKALLAAHGIALWDVVTECEIKGSADASIRDYTVADVPAFIAAHGISRVFVNGKRALSILLAAHPDLAPVIKLLPSTSPANPRFDKKEWFDALDTFRPLPL